MSGFPPAGVQIVVRPTRKIQKLMPASAMAHSSEYWTLVVITTAMATPTAPIAQYATSMATSEPIGNSASAKPRLMRRSRSMTRPLASAKWTWVRGTALASRPSGAFRMPSSSVMGVR
ncbi:MAG: hypothetical protein V5A24_05655 [Haloarculaceae archaeon]